MAFRLAVCTDQDMDRAFTIISDSFGHEHPYIDYVFPHHDTAEGRRVGAERIRAMKNNDPNTTYLKVTDLSTGMIIAVAKWNVYDGVIPDEVQLEGDYWENKDRKELAQEIFAGYLAPRRKAIRESGGKIIPNPHFANLRFYIPVMAPNNGTSLLRTQIRYLQQRANQQQCDLQPLPQGCSNCLKSGRPCPGYRNQLDLMFEDQSQQVIKKAQPKKPPATGRPDASSRKQRKSGPQNGRDTRSHFEGGSEADQIAGARRASQAIVSRPRKRVAMDQFPTAEPAEIAFALDRQDDPIQLIPNVRSYSPIPSWEDRGLAFFDSFFVLGQGPSINDKINETLLSSMKAVGLAGFSSYAYAPELRHEARKLYLEAIQSTNAALRSPTQAKADSTLLAIIILSQFEVLTDASPRSITTWENHAKGAAALLRLRGPEALRSPTGIRLFIHVASTLTTNCLKHKLPLPDIVEELADEASKYVIRSDPAWRYFELSRRITDYYSRVRRGLIPSIHSILASALDLEQLAITSFIDVSPRWHFTVVATAADPDVVFNGYYHVYDNFLIAHIWNGIRVLRMLLHEVICRTIVRDGFSTPPYSTLEQYNASTQTTLRLQADILASVPQNIGYVTYHKKPSSSTESSSYLDTWERPPSSPPFPWTDFRTKDAAYEIFDMTKWDDSKPRYELPLTRLFGGSLMPWALYTVSMVDVATDDVRAWCSRVLKFMGSKMGLRQAEALAVEIDNVRYSQVPVVQAKLGS
ncbi:MAG: hypothetical protein Q9227_009331 [Pyrenula ochraceoflavens]